MIVLIGMLSLPLFGGRTLASPLMAEFIVTQAGGFLAGVLFVAVLAAILSTMDTAINTGALSLAHDVLERIVPPSGGRRAVTLGRIATGLVGSLAFLVATQFTSILKTIGLASEVMAEGLFVPGVAMVFLKRRLPTAGLLSLAGGGGFALAGFLSQSGLIDLGLPVWPYSVPPGVGLSLAGFLAGWLIDSRRSS
jgi:SSS family solute:Na+ symporter